MLYVVISGSLCGRVDLINMVDKERFVVEPFQFGVKIPVPNRQEAEEILLELYNRISRQCSQGHVDVVLFNRSKLVYKGATISIHDVRDFDV